MIYIFAIVSIIGIAIVLLFFLLMMVLNIRMLGSIRGNGVRINEKQFPDVYERVVKMSNQMGLKDVPDVFVIQSEGILNAFATRFWGRNMVVLYSEIFDLGREEGKEELDFIIAHELSHVKRRHVWKSILIAPAQFIPFLSQAYSRSCEYTCDREAAYTINDVGAAKRALTILSVGKQVYREVNEDAFVEQIQNESHGAVWISEILSTHPNLPKRVQSVSLFMENAQRPVYKENAGKVAVGVTILGAVLMAAYLAFIGGLILVGTSLGAIFAGLFVDEFDEFGQSSDWAFGESPEEFEGSYDEYDFYNDYEMTDLMIAIYEEDLQAVTELINQDVDLEEQDLYGDTAIMYAVESFDQDILEEVLIAGADPNVLDSYETTPLITAIYSGFYDGAILLLDYGADPAYRDIDGDTAYSLMDVSTEEDLYEALLDE
ncbi:M48 family metalloprotease [Alkalicoccobacillus porphyridii]|uniref:M48 family metalloprotease n=2 Tax=Alkalicoccobacillus porphyridii TaxID=2597270 RepID=A0A554A1I6_9BACI|nr:M48 family metalloprotease [Alkalicoccobacillus porphyridii]